MFTKIRELTTIAKQAIGPRKGIQEKQSKGNSKFCEGRLRTTTGQQE
jgi:hypothetical protein